MNGLERCLCVSLPDVFADSYLTSVAAVAAFAGEERDAEHAAYYRCLDCGQWWRDGFGDDRALRKVFAPEG